VDDSNPLPGADAGTFYTTSLGVSGQAVSSSDATTPLVITDSPATGQKVVLDDLILSADTAMLVTLRTTTDHKIMGKFELLAGGPPCQLTTRGKWKAPTADETLELLASVSGNLYATPLWHSEP
jgi:hypothetical protein